MMVKKGRFPILVFLFIIGLHEYKVVESADGEGWNPTRVIEVDEVSRIDRAGSPIDILCQAISFINKLFNFKFLSDLCKNSKPNQSTTSAPSSTTPSTTIKPPSPQTISFSGVDYVYLSCHHMPGTIKLIDAAFGKENSSCPSPISMASNLTRYTNGKTSVMLSFWYIWAYCQSSGKCNTLLNCNGTFFFNGTYTCAPINTPDGSMVADAFDGSTFDITCPAGTIAIDSAVYGSIDDVTCPPRSVLSNPLFQGGTSGLTSFSLGVSSSERSFKDCSAANTTNKLSVAYRCPIPAPSTLKTLSRPLGDLHMVCPTGEIDVTSVIFRSDRNSSCFNDATTLIRSLVPPKTTEAFFRNFVNLFTCSNFPSADMTASYSCVAGTAVSQFTLVAQENAKMVLQCPYGQKIQLVSSKYYCATNSSEKVYQNPAGVVKRCDGKGSICSFYVTKWNVLDIPFNSSTMEFSAFPNCYIYGKDQVSLPSSMLSITYTCAV